MQRINLDEMKSLNFEEMKRLYIAHGKLRWLSEFWRMFARKDSQLNQFEAFSSIYLRHLQEFGLQEDSIFCYEFLLVKSYEKKQLRKLIDYASILTRLYESKLTNMFERKQVHKGTFKSLFGKLYLVNKFKLKSYEKIRKEFIQVDFSQISREIKSLSLYLNNSGNCVEIENLEVLLIKVVIYF